MKLTRIAIFAAGYVLGTRAGRERYAQIVAAARNASQRLEEHFEGGNQPNDRTAYSDGTTHGGSGQQ